MEWQCGCFDCANWEVPTEGHRHDEATDVVIHNITLSDDYANKNYEGFL